MECKKWLFCEICNIKNFLKQTNFVSIITMAKKICHYHLKDTQITNSFTTFSTIYMIMKTRITGRSTTRRHTNILNIDVEIMNMRYQRLQL